MSYSYQEHIKRDTRIKDIFPFSEGCHISKNLNQLDGKVALANHKRNKKKNLCL